ncbi:MAG: VWA domain-containing protein [Solirubrobacteraceae bacterium]
MSFAWPLVLLALAAIPAAIVWYGYEQRRRRRAALAFAQPQLNDSVTPHRPGWRRHAVMLTLLIALAALIVAAARPQHTVAVPIDSAAIMLVNDISDSMTATDVRPSRLAAAQHASERFVRSLPATAEVGQLEFARYPVIAQSPTTNHALTLAAIAGLKPGGGGTATGDAIELAVRVLTAVRENGRRPPGAIVLLSDGGANVGVNVVTAARQAKAQHVPVYTIALGTPNGTIPIRRHGQLVNAPVPVSTQQLAQIASASGGRAFTAADSAHAQAIYDHLAAELGHRRVKRELTATVAGAGLALLVLGGGLSLAWFARPI